LQSHYRSTNDLTDDALQAAEKGYKRLMEAYKSLSDLLSDHNNPTELDSRISDIINGAYADMDDDFNTPRAIARLFELVTIINSLKEGQIRISEISDTGIKTLKSAFETIIFEIFGLKEENSTNDGVVDGLMQLIIELRQIARTNKEWTTADKIRDGLNELQIQIKDGKDGSSWSFS
ncbi:MAG TPA: cysteine--tRNA ligase, partial [Saprospiraceae bacterium]|nr:cysteine--tRNA ligase [Saprospiraceae bacterium]